MVETIVADSRTDTILRVDEAWTALAAPRRALVTGGASAGLAMALAATSVVSPTTAVVLAAVSLAAGAAAVVDVHEHRIPNRLLTLSLVLVAVAALIERDATLGDVAVSGLMASGPLWIVRYGRGLGIGDVKFAAVLGAAGGLVHPLTGVVVVWLAALSSGVFAAVQRRQRLALGPWLWAGFVGATSVAVLVVQIAGSQWPARW
jgi:prepilin signal peptidase PulO-like enzyme (type II secretory pathway)